MIGKPASALVLKMNSTRLERWTESMFWMQATRVCTSLPEMVQRSSDPGSMCRILAASSSTQTSGVPRRRIPPIAAYDIHIIRHGAGGGHGSRRPIAASETFQIHVGRRPGRPRSQSSRPRCRSTPASLRCRAAALPDRAPRRDPWARYRSGTRWACRAARCDSFRRSCRAGPDKR